MSQASANLALVFAVNHKEVIAQSTFGDASDLVQTAALSNRVPGADLGQFRHDFGELIDQRIGEPSQFDRFAFSPGWRPRSSSDGPSERVP